MNRDLYKRSFTEHPIPDNLRWVDELAPWVIFYFGVAILGVTIWEWV